jgi:hypothetical protein
MSNTSWAAKSMKAEEVPGRNAVRVGKIEVPGFISETRCPACGEFQIYHEGFDAHFCPSCNVWLEAQCGAPGCQFCGARPAKPLR